MKSPLLGRLAVAGAALLLSFSANAALSIRDLDGDWSNGHEGVYDDVLDITWLADANIRASLGLGTFRNDLLNGYSSWLGAQPWASSFELHGYTNWRLPSNSTIDNNSESTGNNGSYNRGYNITRTSSELSYMFYVNLANNGARSVTGEVQASTLNASFANDRDPNNIYSFANIEPRNYWYEESSPWAFYYYHSFDMGTGFQFHSDRAQENTYVWIVHDGDIGAAVVPIPTTAWLFFSALAGLSVARGKSRKRDDV